MNESRRKLTDSQVGILVKKLEEVKKRIENHSLGYQSTLYELKLLTKGKGWIINDAIRKGLEFTQSDNKDFLELPLQNVVDEQMLVYQIFLVYQKIKDLLEQQYLNCNETLNYNETILALQGIIENKGYLMRQVVAGSARIVDCPELVDFSSCPRSIKGFQVGFNNFQVPAVFNLQDYELLVPKELKNGFSPDFFSLREKSPNVNIFYFLRDNQNLIPQDWTKGYICSVGTIYCDNVEDNSYIPCLAYRFGSPYLELVPLESDFDESFYFLAYKDANINGFKKGKL